MASSINRPLNAKNREALLAFYDFPAEHWLHLLQIWLPHLDERDLSLFAVTSPLFIFAPGDNTRRAAACVKMYPLRDLVLVKCISSVLIQPY
jgi:hypothetical protein